MIRFMPFFGTLLLALLCGYLIGRIAAVQWKIADVPPLHLQEEDREGSAVVEFATIEDGYLKGEMQGDVRVFIGEDQVLPGEDGTFAISPGFFLRQDISVLVPKGMEFVASKRGKKYYPVFSEGGQRIVLENRVYFETAEEAEEAGYER